ncbi:MAG: leucyl aminopeptidase [Deltaproteobacteria bacterium]|nr:leucyl aminopeptidase [Deltaproteobacteria bacterium]
MQCLVQSGSLLACNVDLLAITVLQRKENGVSRAQLQRGDGGVELDRALGGKLSEVITREELTGELGTARLVETNGQCKARHVVLLGGGTVQSCTTNTWRRLGVTLARVAEQVKARSAAGLMQTESVQRLKPAVRAQALIEGLMLGQYRFDTFKPEDERKPLRFTSFIAVSKGNRNALEAAFTRGALVAGAICQARDWINLPSNVCTPQYLAEQAQLVAKRGHLKCQILDSDQITAERMHLLKAVNQGSARPPIFIHVSYTPKGKAKRRVALVGKGVTFDTGGYDLKTSKHMGDMKNDMGGAAVVLATMQVMAALQPAIAIDAYIPSTENMVDALGYKSSDILTARSGKTIEIVNTDAEGRLVLADAIDYAVEREPELLIDLATLTGGVQYALGEIYTAVLGTAQSMINKLLAASTVAGEAMWQLPLEEEYLAGFKGGPAQLRNCGKSGASTITGALFLGQFVREVPWIHLDIAESAWSDEDRPLTSRGGTGAPLRTLCEFLLSL